jgi:hypothetical protein
MSTENPVGFARPFRPGDVAVFRELTERMIGLPLVRWRETYADGVVLEFGSLIPRATIRSDRIPQDRGEWVVSTWGCDLEVTPRGGQVFDNRAGVAAVRAPLDRALGGHVAALAVADDLSLVIQLSDGTAIVCRTDITDPDLDQWIIRLPTYWSIGASANGRWYLRPDGSPE